MFICKTELSKWKWKVSVRCLCSKLHCSLTGVLKSHLLYASSSPIIQRLQNRGINRARALEWKDAKDKTWTSWLANSGVLLYFSLSLQIQWWIKPQSTTETNVKEICVQAANNTDTHTTQCSTIWTYIHCCYQALVASKQYFSLKQCQFCLRPESHH